MPRCPLHLPLTPRMTPSPFPATLAALVSLFEAPTPRHPAPFLSACCLRRFSPLLPAAACPPPAKPAFLSPAGRLGREHAVQVRDSPAQARPRNSRGTPAVQTRSPEGRPCTAHREPAPRPCTTTKYRKPRAAPLCRTSRAGEIGSAAATGRAGASSLRC